VPVRCSIIQNNDTQLLESSKRPAYPSLQKKTPKDLLRRCIQWPKGQQHEYRVRIRVNSTMTLKICSLISPWHRAPWHYWYLEMTTEIVKILQGMSATKDIDSRYSLSAIYSDTVVSDVLQRTTEILLWVLWLWQWEQCKSRCSKTRVLTLSVSWSKNIIGSTACWNQRRLAVNSEWSGQAQCQPYCYCPLTLCETILIMNCVLAEAFRGGKPFVQLASHVLLHSLGYYSFYKKLLWV
jgi:hypothetical protein